MRQPRAWLVVVGCAGILGVASAQPEPPPEEAPPAPPPTGAIAGTIESPELDGPVAGAAVSIVGTAIATTTDDLGQYQLVAPPGQVRVRAEFTGFRPEERAATITAGGTARLDLALSPVQLLNETVIVLGSRTPRSNVETPVPVDIVTSEEIARSGRTEVGRVLHALAVSYSSLPQTQADGSDHIDPASLRGLGPDQVLVLVNGKRRHRSALMHVNGTFGRGTVGTDLNAIAIGSIKRIEILRDGATSQYGSDAIAGVINIVTKDSTDVAEATAETGVTGSGDGLQTLGTVSYGFKIGDKGFLHLTGEFLRRNRTNRSGVYTGTVYDEDRVVDNRILDEAGRTRADFQMKIGEASATFGVGAFQLEVPIADGARVYSFGDVSHRTGLSAGFYRFPKQVAQNVPEFYPDGFLPYLRAEIDDAAVTVGVRRKGPWNLDASLTHGRSSFQFEVEDSVNASLGTASPRAFDAGTLSFSQTVADFDARRKLDTDLVRSSWLVLGSEFRLESYQIEAGDEASYASGPEVFGVPPQPKLPGAQVFPGFQPSNEVERTRNNIGFYGGLESELVKGVTLDLGARAETYSDFGRSIVGKAAARAQLVRWLSVRGAVSNGFRAPSLHQLWFSNVQTLYLPGSGLRPSQVLTSNNASSVTKAFGIPTLHEERSINVSGGVAIRPRDNLSITADGYFIRIADRILLTSQFDNTSPIVAEILAPFPGVSQAQFFANAVDTHTSGVDIVADYTAELGRGVLGVTAAGNLTTTRVKRVKIPPMLRGTFADDPGQLRAFFFDRAAENRLEDTLPHQRATASIRYALEPVSALVRANYYGPANLERDEPDTDERFGAKVLFDLNVGVEVTQQVLFTVGADNVFNTFPDRFAKDVNQSFGRNVYSRNQFGQNGGFYYAKLSLTLL